MSWVGRSCVLALTALSLSAPAASLAEPSCDASVDASSGSLGDLPMSVTGPPTAATAVGIHFVGGDGSPLVLERVGDGWRTVRVQTQPGARTIELQDAAAAGPRVWVVGAFRNDRPQAGLIHGGRWFWTHPIDPGDGEDEFLGVAATSEGTVWAVGQHQVGADYQPLIERYDGATWSVVPVPAVEGSAVLKDIAVAPTGALYAVGWRVVRGGVTEPLVMARSDGRWAIEPTRGSGLLSGVTTGPDGAPIAVGWVPANDGDRVLTLVRRGSWRPIGGSQPGRLTGVTSGNAATAVGTRVVDGVPAPLAMRLSGDEWSPVPLGDERAVGTGGDQLLGVTGEEGSFLAVGIRDASDAFASLVVTGDCVG